MQNHYTPSKALYIIGGLILAAIIAGLSLYLDAQAQAHRLSLERGQALKMAECYEKIYAGEAKACRYEYHYTDDGQTLYAVSVKAEPME